VLKWRPDLPYLVLSPLLIAAAGVLSYYTWETATRYEELGASSIAHSTLLLVEEKVDRIEQQIIAVDNAVFHLIDIGDPEGLRSRWLPFAARISPSVRAVVIMTEDHEVVDYVARASSSEERAFLKIFKKYLLPEIEIPTLELERLHHLHTALSGTSYLISYKLTEREGQRFLVAAHHDTGYLVREDFPRLFSSDEARAQFNIVDDDNRRMFGESLRDSGDYIVGVRFPTTLYRWRMQIAPKDAPLLEEQARQREFNKASLIALSVLVLLLGVVFLLYATIQERRLNALKSDFIANVSHELKTPLSVVRMFAEMLLSERVSSVEKQRQYLEMICRESERLSSLIENVLDFAALERGKQKFQPLEADLSAIVTRGVETVRHRLESTEVRLHLPPDVPSVVVDEDSILLALINLLDNAAKYGEGTPIDVSLEVQRREVVVSVRDRGPGIPREDEKRVFDRFYRVPRPGQHVRGSGIGLSLVKHIAEAHGGRAFTRNAPDGGAVVSFSVPLHRRSAEAKGLKDASEGVSS